LWVNHVDKLNFKVIEKLLDYFNTFLEFKEYIDVYFANVEGKDSSCMSNLEFDKTYVQLIRLLYDKGFVRFFDYMYPYPKTLSCGAITNNSFVIDPKGDIYTCYEKIGCYENKVGDIFNGININSSYPKWLCVENYKECNTCVMLPICQGGCPLSKINNKKFECNFNINSCKEILKKFYSVYIDQKTNL
jgi:uncharacterized protein